MAITCMALIPSSLARTANTPVFLSIISPKHLRDMTEMCCRDMLPRSAAEMCCRDVSPRCAAEICRRDVSPRSPVAVEVILWRHAVGHHHQIRTLKVVEPGDSAEHHRRRIGRPHAVDIRENDVHT